MNSSVFALLLWCVALSAPGVGEFSALAAEGELNGISLSLTANVLGSSLNLTWPRSEGAFVVETALDATGRNWEPSWSNSSSNANIFKIGAEGIKLFRVAALKKMSVDEIQAALDALGPEGGTVSIPAGEYKLSKPLRLPSNVRLVGAGHLSRLLLADKANTNLITNKDWDRGNSNIFISGIYLDGNRLNQTNLVGDGPGQSLVDLVNVRHIVVENVRGASSVLHGINVGVRDEAHNLIKTILISTGIGRFQIGEAVLGISSSATGTIVGVGVEDDYVTIRPANGSFISGEVLWGRTSGAKWTATSDPQAHGSSDAQIVNCEFRDFGDDGVTTHYSSGVTVENCRFQDAAASYSASSNGIEFDDGSFDNIAKNCWASNCVRGFMAQGHAGRVPAHNVEFRDCIALKCQSGIRAVQTAPNASVAASDVTVTGGVFEDCVEGVTFYNYSSSLVQNARVTRATHAIRFLSDGTAPTKNIRITNCVFNIAPLLLTGTASRQIEFENCELRGCVNKVALTIEMPEVHWKGGIVESNAGTGIQVSGLNSLIMGAIIRKNLGTGVETTGGNAHISANEITENAMGLRLTSGTNVVIESNRFVRNRSYGIEISSSGGSAVVRSNSANGNAVRPIMIDVNKGDGVTLEENDFLP
jgi:parallel beta-helix repeat protein